MIGLEYIVKEFHMGYREVAKQLGVSPQTIQDWLKERRKIPEKRLEQLSFIFKLPTEYFHKELNNTEKLAVTVSYLKSISESIEVPVLEEEDGEIIINHHSATYEDEIKFLENILETKKKAKLLKDEINKLMEVDENLEADIEAGAFNPLQFDFSNTVAIQNMVEILNNEKLASQLKVVVYLMNQSLELGGKPKVLEFGEYKNLAEDTIQLLSKHKK
ncbi:helix-turn-helix transcriptional regulator [Planococcus maritimus]|uniref:Helix-turn-helix transcriptional regulator n=1 Tax=Planococcus maritimus TaxID=192421 RepID=A0A7D7MH57_PLAMR|nr:helix-turn-helix transcriptional regulator [Planococcus maritimus]QMT16246.1 helix-turn-helix transcriptional regulator [Planococcus maritimus]